MKRIYAPTIGGLPGIILDGGVRNLSDEVDMLDGMDAAKAVHGAVSALGDRVVSEVYPHFGWKKARDKAIAMFRAGELEFFCPSGHSYGGWRLIQMAVDLQKLGIMCRYLFALDTTAGPKQEVPAYVEYVHEFWAKSGPPAMARHWQPSGEGGGKYLYPHGTKHEIHEYDIGHIPLGSDARVHGIICDKIKELM